VLEGVNFSVLRLEPQIASIEQKLECMSPHTLEVKEVFLLWHFEGIGGQIFLGSLGSVLTLPDLS